MTEMSAISLLTGSLLLFAAGCCAPRGQITGSVEVWGENVPHGVTDIRVVMLEAPAGEAPADPVTVQSGEDGTFVVTGLVPGARYELTVTDPELITEPVEVTLDAEQPEHALEPPLLVHAWHDVGVTVRHCMDLGPIANAPVSIDGEYVTTDDEGKALRTAVGPPGRSVSIVASPDGFVVGETQLDIRPHPPWTLEWVATLCPSTIPSGAVLYRRGDGGELVGLKRVSVRADDDMRYTRRAYHFDRDLTTIPLAEAQAAPGVGERSRLLVDDRMLRGRGRYNKGAMVSRLLMSEPDGRVTRSSDWAHSVTQRIPKDSKIPTPGAYVGDRFSWLAAASQFTVEVKWKRLGEGAVTGAFVPDGWTLVELPGAGPWGIVTTNAPEADSIFVLAP